MKFITVRQTQVEKACRDSSGRPSYRWANAWAVCQFDTETRRFTDVLAPYFSGRGAKKEAIARGEELAEEKGLQFVEEYD